VRPNRQQHADEEQDEDYQQNRVKANDFAPFVHRFHFAGTHARVSSMRQSEYTNGRACDENIAAPEGRLFAGVHGMPAGRNSSCSAPIASALRKLPEKLTFRAKPPTQLQRSSDTAILVLGSNILAQCLYRQPRFLLPGAPRQ
jgi:hypothetical protein